MYYHLIIAALSCSTLLADELTKKANETIAKTQSKAKSQLPVLKILPTGSVLKNISIPRYNKDYSPSSLLTADQFEVISGSEIKGTNVGISLYDEAGKVKTRSILNEASYDQAAGHLTSKENITFSGDDFIASSQGVIIDWENHCGFLLGKNQTIIYLKKLTPMMNSKKPTVKESNNSTLSSKSKSIAVAGVIAATSPFLSAEDLAEIDKLSQPSTQLFIQQLDATKAALTATAEAEAKIAKTHKDLKNKFGSIPTIGPSHPAPAELLPKDGSESINIKSDRLLFDAKKGIFVYYGNVRITHPKCTFSCDGELKVLLKESFSAKKLNPTQRAKLNPNNLFDYISQIIATKNVTLRSKDKKGRDVSAVTQNLSFNKATGNIILKGKNSRITTADGQLKVVTNNGYIKIDQEFNASGQGTSSDFNVPKK